MGEGSAHCDERFSTLYRLTWLLPTGFYFKMLSVKSVMKELGFIYILNQGASFILIVSLETCHAIFI